MNLNITINELKNQKNNVHKYLEGELKLSYKLYNEHKEEDFEVEDHYFKFLLFSMYRAIEDLMKLVIEERKINSYSKPFYHLICKKNLKSYFITNDWFQIILDDLNVSEVKISYQDIFNYIKNSELSISNLTFSGINEVKPSGSNKNDNINIESLLQIYSDCHNNRNGIMHSITKNIDLTKEAIKNSFIVYSFLSLLLTNILN